MAIAPRQATIAVVMVNYRTPALVETSLAALAAEREVVPSLRVVVVDGGSGDGSAERLARLVAEPRFAGWVALLPLATNGGFGWANNQAIQRLLQGDAPPDYIHLLNPDAVVERGAVAALAAALDAHPGCAAVGSLLLDAGGHASGSAFNFPSVRTEMVRGLPMAVVARVLGASPLARTEGGACEVGWVTGASTMLRAAALRQVGLFDTGFFLYFEETELMWRLARAGWTIRYEPASRVRHLEGAATGINGTAPTALRPALPAYWYRSRLRYFALTGGRGRALAASLGYLAGHAALMCRKALGGGGQHALIDRDARRMLAHGVIPSAEDCIPAVARWDDAIDQLPAWMVGIRSAARRRRRRTTETA